MSVLRSAKFVGAANARTRSNRSHFVKGKPSFGGREGKNKEWLVHPRGKLFKLVRYRGSVLGEHLQRRKSNKGEDIAERGTKLEGRCDQ
ncbi:hypothetical protein POVWA1_072380 [Plasmodium ovale wallikeri]|uniref:Uncharacterized protein n=1 Tax=Plasmodium ovale wallikeri TaxID=864142 RepID=A0A1A9AGW5_PLAOA|nr:hypothetical protein POVWA1_072380 [Plasmodium ovale wallikeri]